MANGSSNNDKRRKDYAEVNNAVTRSRPGPPQMGISDAHVGMDMSPSRMKEQQKRRKSGIPER